jgi:enoyl-CoA hydratase/carnithine racemase
MGASISSGPARVTDLIFTARVVGAEEGTSVGLLNEVVEDISSLQERCEARWRSEQRCAFQG